MSRTDYGGFQKLRDLLIALPPSKNPGYLDVDGIIKHQIDIAVMDEVAVEIANRFKDLEPTKVISVEASGISPATLVALHLKIPLLIVSKSLTAFDNKNDYYISQVHSFTKQNDVNVSILKKFITPQDRFLFVDDFLALGNATKAILNLARAGGASVIGFSFFIEKSFQGGRKNITKFIDELEEGPFKENCKLVRIQTAAIVDSWEGGKLILNPNN